MSEIPQKLFYKIGEVCQYTDTQPYVLRFWESEFPALGTEKNRNGQRVYRRQDIDLILRIKRLLNEEEYSIAEARKRLEEDSLAGLDAKDGKKKAVTVPGRKSSAKAKQPEPEPAREARRPERFLEAEEEAQIPVRAPAAVEELLHRLEESDALLHSTREALHAEEQRLQECQQRRIAIADRLEALADRMKDRPS